MPVIKKCMLEKGKATGRSIRGNDCTDRGSAAEHQFCQIFMGVAPGKSKIGQVYPVCLPCIRLNGGSSAGLSVGMIVCKDLCKGNRAAAHCAVCYFPADFTSREKHIVWLLLPVFDIAKDRADNLFIPLEIDRRAINLVIILESLQPRLVPVQEHEILWGVSGHAGVFP